MGSMRCATPDGIGGIRITFEFRFVAFSTGRSLGEEYEVGFVQKGRVNMLVRFTIEGGCIPITEQAKGRLAN